MCQDHAKDKREHLYSREARHAPKKFGSQACLWLPETMILVPVSVLKLGQNNDGQELENAKTHDDS